MFVKQLYDDFFFLTVRLFDLLCLERAHILTSFGAGWKFRLKDRGS